jgi:hypothetical protein
MEIFEFAQSLKTLCDFYERKEPKQSTIELWFESVHKMPSEPLKWIVKKIQETHDSFPKNMPSAFWSGYTEWQSANPDKRATPSFFACSDCNEGLIFANKVVNKIKYSYVFRCTKCKQNHNNNYPAMSRLELLENYEVCK